MKQESRTGGRCQPLTTSLAELAEGRKIAYSVAAAAATLASQDADAQVVYGGVINESIEQFSRLELVVVDDGLAVNDPGGPPPTDPNADILLENYVFLGGNYQGAVSPFAPGGLVGMTVGFSYATALSDGFLVDGSSVDSELSDVSLAYGPVNPSAEFNDVVDAFIGFSFPIFPEGAEEPNEHFGWVRVSINNAEGTFLVSDFAYESTPGVGILTGDTGASGVPGDFNNDGRVDAADFTVWRDNLGVVNDSASGLGDPLSGNGDDSGNSAGIVDLDDYALFVSSFGQTAPPPVVTALPEPITLGLLAAGPAGLAVLRRSRRSKPQ